MVGSPQDDYKDIASDALVKGAFETISRTSKYLGRPKVTAQIDIASINIKSCPVGPSGPTFSIEFQVTTSAQKVSGR